MRSSGLWRKDRPPRAGVARLNNEAPIEDIQIISVERVGSDLQLTFSSVIGGSYTVQGTSDFITWNDVRTVTASSSTTVVPGLPMTSQYQFFRVISP